MKKSNILIFVFLPIMVWSCTSKKTFDREESLHNYLEQVVAHKFEDKELVFILNNGRCGSCYQEDIKELRDIFHENTTPKTIVMATEAPSIREPLSVLPNVHFYIDNNKIERYGLSYGVDMVFLLEKGKVKDWARIQAREMDYLRKHINL